TVGARARATATAMRRKVTARTGNKTMKQTHNESRSRNRVRLSTRGLRILTAIALGVLFSTGSIAFAADSLAWDKTFPQIVVYHSYSSYARGVGGLWGMSQWLIPLPLSQAKQMSKRTHRRE